MRLPFLKQDPIPFMRKEIEERVEAVRVVYTLFKNNNDLDEEAFKTLEEHLFEVSDLVKNMRTNISNIIWKYKIKQEIYKLAIEIRQDFSTYLNNKNTY